MRLIDADAIKYEPLPKGERNYRTYNLDDAYDDGYDDAMFDVKHTPTVDAVPITRCKDCKWWRPNKETCIEWYDSPYAPADGYCFRAERKEKDGE